MARRDRLHKRLGSHKRLLGCLLVAAVIAAGCGGSEGTSTEAGIAEVRVVDEGSSTTAATPASAATSETTDTTQATTGTANGDPGTTSTSAGAATPVDPTVPLLDLSKPVEVADEITISNDSRHYAFEGVEGTRIAVEVTALNDSCGGREKLWDLHLELRDPAGEEIESDWPGNSGCRGYGPWTLPETGRFTLVAASGGIAQMAGSKVKGSTGSFRMTVAQLLDLEERIDPTVPVTITGEIGIAQDSRQYIFDGTAGQRLSVEVTEINGPCDGRKTLWDVRLSLVDSVGDEVESAWPGNSGCKGYGPWEIPVDGEYRVVAYSGGAYEIAGSSAPGATGTFTMIVATVR